MLKEKLGRRIKEIRKARGYSQEQLAELINMDIPNLSNIERGKRFMTAETLEKIAKALDVTEKELFDDNIISSLSVAKGIDVTKIKLALQPKLDEYLQEKLNYVKLAFKHLHSLYSYNTSEK